MTAVGFITAQESDFRVDRGRCEKEVEAFVSCVCRFLQTRSPMLMIPGNFHEATKIVSAPLK
jgi:hypothetical protein